MTTATETTTEENTPFKRYMESIQAKDADLVELDLDKYTLGPWSISKIKVLEKCPFQFYLKYILKAKVPENVAKKQDSLSADVGSAAHRILELVMLGKKVDDGYATTKKEFVPSKLTEDQWEEKVVPLETNIRNFQERMESVDRNLKIKRVLTELRIGITKDYEPTHFFAEDVYMRGIVDLVVVLENGDILIIDHKTGGGMGSIRPYEDQLNSYKVMFHFGVDKIKGAQSFIHYIGAGEVKKNAYSPVEEIEGKLVKALEWIIEGAIDGVKELGFFKHVRGSYCKWCEFDGAGCKSGDLKPLELSTKRFIPIKAE